MLINIIRAFVLLAGPAVGYFQVSRSPRGVILGLGAAFFVIAAELIINRVALDAFISAVIGGILGLVSAQLAKWVAFQTGSEVVYDLVQKGSLLIHLVMACLGMLVAVHKRSELDLLDRDIIVKGNKKKNQTVYLVDTSALIDGRVADVCETRFIAGTLVVPRFILTELQQVADSADTAKRARGRRGLDILVRLQENPDVPVKVFDKDFADIKEVDGKLVALARELGARVVTTDFNLNKVAGLQGVTVMNVNDLANALRPVVLPGEVMNVFLVKEGREKDQGVAYLDDGTMVVVEDGRRALGQRVRATVTSIRQTSAGRMIFAKAVRDKESRPDAPARHSTTGEVKETSETVQDS
jgi:uncharacterized protein YacL